MAGDGMADVAFDDLARRRERVRELFRPVRQGDQLASHETTRHLPAHPRIAELLPWSGLRRGAAIEVTGSASLLLAVVAGAMRDGGWAAIVGLPEFGMVAAAEHDGMDLRRLGLVPAPGPDWPRVVGALIDGVDLVVVAPPGAPSADIARSLSARARKAGTVLVAARPGWPGADLILHATGRHWTGLGQGRGRLRRLELDVRVTGRGAALRPKTARLPMPLPPTAGENVQARRLESDGVPSAATG
jgi:hypothetical protein